MTPNNTHIEEKIDKTDSEIMDWIYELARINFDVEGWVQDSTELREILRQAFTDLLDMQKKEIVEMLKTLYKQDHNGKGLPFENSPEIYGNERLEAYKKGFNTALDDAITKVKG